MSTGACWLQCCRKQENRLTLLEHKFPPDFMASFDSNVLNDSNELEFYFEFNDESIYRLKCLSSYRFRNKIPVYVDFVIMVLKWLTKYLRYNAEISALFFSLSVLNLTRVAIYTLRYKIWFCKIVSLSCPINGWAWTMSASWRKRMFCLCERVKEEKERKREKKTHIHNHCQRAPLNSMPVSFFPWFYQRICVSFAFDLCTRSHFLHD